MSENENQSNFQNYAYQQQQAQQPYYYYPNTSPAFYPVYPTRQFNQGGQQQQQQQQQQQPQQTGGMLPTQQSFIENILRLNRGMLGSFYMTFENSSEQEEFRGYIEEAGRDHILIREEDSERRILLLMVYLDYVTFDEEINYSYPFGQQLSTYSPR
ncbi:spore coat protein GerQ [Oceanobacillus sp. 1P07AA]|uniref:spore coat protein GerQ n=1 Tax=Oceanobacillus sp. 1P07AA TaxID=3132293 RepID=UPI0039A7752B